MLKIADFGNIMQVRGVLYYFTAYELSRVRQVGINSMSFNNTHTLVFIFNTDEKDKLYTG